MMTNTNFLIALIISGTIVFLGEYLLLFCRKKNCHGALFVPARKSSSNAILLGGLPLALGILIGAMLLSFEFSAANEKNVFWIWFACSFIIIFYGYLDDRFEIRPIIKLSAQVLTIFVFSLATSQLLHPANSSLAFVGTFLWGIGVINGANLLDGLDGMSVKLGTASFVVFGILGYLFNAPFVIWLSALVVVALLAFYQVNKAPAKIHLGEIGGCFIGFAAIFTSNILYLNIKSEMSSLSAFFFCIIPLTFYMVEVGVSMLRRLFNRKAPFKGDRLHIHQLLVNFYGLTVSRATNYMALSLFGILAFSIFLATIVPIAGEFFAIFSLTLISFAVGHKHWRSSRSIHLSPSGIIQNIKKDEILIIDQRDADQFTFSIVPQVEEQHNELIAS